MPMARSKGCAPFRAPLIGNIINAAAAWTAITRYGQIVRGEARPRWDKTDHRYPAEPNNDSIEPGRP